MAKYIKLMDGLKSNAGGFQYKIGELNVADNWNPTTFDPVVMGGFNFSTEEKILRWIHRGDTVYDVEIPKDAEVIDCPSPNCPHGVFGEITQDKIVRETKTILDKYTDITTLLSESLKKLNSSI